MALEKQFKKGILSNIADAVSGFARDMYATAKNARNAINIVYADFVGSLNHNINPDFYKPYMDISEDEDRDNFSRVYQNWQDALAGPDRDEDVQAYEAHIRNSYPWEDILNDLENGNAAILARNETRKSLVDIVRLPDGKIDAQEYERLCDEAGIGYVSEQLEPSVKRYSIMPDGFVVDREYDPADLFWEGAKDAQRDTPVDDVTDISLKDLQEVPAFYRVSDEELLRADLYQLIGAEENKVVLRPEAPDRKQEIVDKLYESIDDATQAYEFATSSNVNTQYTHILDNCLDEARTLVATLNRDKRYANGMTGSDYEKVAEHLGKVSDTIYDIVTANLIARELSKAPVEEKKQFAVPKPKQRSDVMSLAPKLSYTAKYGALQ